MSSSAATRSAVMRSSCAAIAAIASRTRGATSKPSCETNRAARSIRSGSSPKDTSGAAGVSSTRARSASKPSSGSRNSPGPSGGDAHRHRVDREVTAHQIVVEAVAEAHLRIARHLVVGVGAEGGDLHALIALADADGAEVDAGVPQRVGPRPQHALHLLGPGVGGEVEVGAEPAQQRVAHAAADEVQLVAGVSEHARRARAARRRAGSAPPGQRRAVRALSDTFNERRGNGPAPSGECGGSEFSWQLLSLGCRTANRPNHDGAGGGVVVAARPVHPSTTTAKHTNNARPLPDETTLRSPTAGPSRTNRGRSRRGPDRLRTVHETSAGGLVIDGIDGPKDSQVAALIGRIDRRGRMLWSLPKGHIELGETAEQTAIREVAEETGIQGSVLAALGSIDYWFVTEGRRVHKTVHHYLMRFSRRRAVRRGPRGHRGGLGAAQGTAVAAGLRRRAQTRRGRRRADRHAAHRRARRAAAAAPHLTAQARRRRTRTPATDVPTKQAHANPGRRTNGCGQGP